jgi:hypothetical protein
VAPLFALLGLAALAAGVVVLRSLGPGVRVGRLLATVPEVSIAEAIALAQRGQRRYVRVAGRIDSEDDFEDEAHRPLVFRRTRLESGGRGRWAAFEDDRRSVPFEVREGPDAVAVDAAALDDGLVVVPGESIGTAHDLGDRAPAGIQPSTRVRLRVEQVSSVEHAIVLGVPERLADGRIGLTAGLGRPLVLTTLEPPEAMRILAAGSVRPRLAAGLFVLGVALLAAAAMLFVVAPSAAFAASPTPPPAGGDPRSAGEGPGLVGDPLLAIAGVAGIGVAAVVATLGYLRLTRDRTAPDATRRDR